MSYKPPKEIAKAGIETGSTKARLSWDKALVAGFLAGAYIAFAGLLAFTVSAGMNPDIWGTLPSFFTGTVFSLGLILVIDRRLRAAHGQHGARPARRDEGPRDRSSSSRRTGPSC